MERGSGIRALSMGALSGVRSSATPAMLANIRDRRERELVYRASGVKTQPARTSRLPGLLEKVELLMNRLPLGPARNSPISLALRAMSGAVAGKAAGGRGDRELAPALLGAAAAIATTLVTHRLRGWAFARSKVLGFLAGRAENTLVHRGGSRLARSVAARSLPPAPGRLRRAFIRALAR